MEDEKYSSELQRVRAEFAERYYTSDDIETKFNLSKRAIQAMAQDGSLLAISMPSQRAYLFPCKETDERLQKFLNKEPSK